MHLEDGNGYNAHGNNAQHELRGLSCGSFNPVSDHNTPASCLPVLQALHSFSLEMDDRSDEVRQNLQPIKWARRKSPHFQLKRHAVLKKWFSSATGIFGGQYNDVLFRKMFCRLTKRH